MNSIDEQIELLQLLKVEIEKTVDFLKNQPIRLENKLIEAKDAGLFLEHYDNLKKIFETTENEINSVISDIENNDIPKIEFCIQNLEDLY
jgi:hypothetical protein